MRSLNRVPVCGCLIIGLLASLAQAASPPPEKQPVPVAGPRATSPVLLPTVQDGRVLRTAKSGDYRVVIDETNAQLSLGMDKEVSERAAGQFRVGDTVRLKRASKVQAQGQTPIPVAQRELLGVRALKPDYGKTEWVGVSVVSVGQLRAGWISAADVELECDESRLYPTIQPLVQRHFASASVLVQKAKVFDDGLMATAQLAAQNGAGQLRGKAEWLPALTALSLQHSPSTAQTLLASAKLGKLPVKVPGDQAAAVDVLVWKFLADELRSKPIGFYTWSPELTSLFQQDRMLQSKLKTSDLGPLVKALGADAKTRGSYEAYVALIARLTNPPVGSDLRTLLAGQTPVEDELPLISASQAPETNLIMQLYGNRPIPEGFDLSSELVTRIRGGQLSLQPKENSGWYDHQLWSLEPLVTPERTAEGKNWSGNEEYRKHLESVFKGAWALARETHIKDLDIPAPASAAPGEEPEPKVQVNIQPQLTTEPLATSYRRRADSYRFVRRVLVEAFGEDALASMRRQTALGPVDRPLSEELTEMEQLFDGAAAVAERQLGMVYAAAEEEPARTLHAQVFLDWVANVDRDPDIAPDVRMMVPVFYDQLRKQTKVWVFLGWTERNMGYSYQTAPGVIVYDAKGTQVAASRLELSYHGNSATVVTPVFREIYVDQLLNRDEFRRVCDAYVSPRAILEQLRSSIGPH